MTKRCLNCAVFIVLGLLILAPAPALALPTVLQKNACVEIDNDFPVIESFLDGTLRLDMWAAMNGLLMRMIDEEEKTHRDIAGRPYRTNRIKDAAEPHIKALWHQAYIAKRPPVELIETYLAETNDPVLKDPANEAELRYWADRLTGMQKIMERVLTLGLDFKALDLYIKTYGGIGRIKGEEARRIGRERYDHRVGKMKMTSHRATLFAYFDLLNLNRQRIFKNPRAKAVETVLTDASAIEIVRLAVNFKTRLVRMQLGLPRKYKKGEWERSAPFYVVRFMQASWLSYFLDDFATNVHSFSETAFANPRCPVSKKTHVRFAFSRDLELELFRPKPVKSWCRQSVRLDAVAADPAVYLRGDFRELMTKGKQAVAHECPQAQTISLTGYMRQDKHPLYRSSWSMSGTKLGPVTQTADPALALYSRAARGDGEAMFDIARKYGRGGWNDIWQQRAWLYKSAHAGYSLAQALLAGAYGPRLTDVRTPGVGLAGWIKPNAVKALYWAEKSKNQGDPVGFWNYAVYLRQHHMGGFYSLESLKKHFTVVGGMGVAALYALTGKPGSGKAAELFGKGARIFVDSAIHEKKAREACQTEKYQSDPRYGPVCRSILKEIQRIHDLAQAMERANSPGGGNACSGTVGRGRATGLCGDYGTDAMIDLMLTQPPPRY